MIPRRDKISSVDELSTYINKQINAEKARKWCCDGYNGNVFIPAVEINTCYRIMPYAGKDLTEQIYSQIKPQEKLKIAKDFALYLNFVHQKSLKKADFLKPRSKTQIGKMNLKDRWLGSSNPEFSLFSQVQKFKKHIGNADYRELETMLNIYSNRSKEDEICVLTHGDLRNQNVLYNSRTKRLAIIDYEVSGVSDIYKDFCPYCFSNLPLEFLKDTICFYNQISSKEEKPLHIDIEKAKLFWQVAQFCELARCTQETGPLSYEQQLKKFKDFQKKIISLEKPTRTSPIIQQAYSLKQR